METLENRTRGGAGVMTRMCHSLGEAVRNVFRAGQKKGLVSASSVNTGTTEQDFFQNNGVLCVNNLPEGTQLYAVIVKNPEGRAAQVFLSDGKVLKRDNLKALFILKVFVLLERCLRQKKGLHLIQAEFALAKVDGRWVLAESPAANRMKFASGEILAEVTLRDILRGSGDKVVYKSKRAA